MKKSRFFSSLLYTISASMLFSFTASAQNGNSRNNRAARPGNNERHYSQALNNRPPVNNNRMHASQQPYRPAYPSYRPGYRPNYYSGYHPTYRAPYYPGYKYHPVYRYRPVYRSPYVYPHFGPAFGVRISVLPFGYYPFYIGNNPFYYYQGIYYRPYNNGGYEVIAPPLGATVKHLPSGAKLTVINGEKYYELGGIFYQEEITTKNKLQYVVVGTDGVINTIEQNEPEPVNEPATGFVPESSVQGTSFNQLPANTRAVMVNQQKYYVSPSGIYYQEVVDVNNNVSYNLAGSDETINSNN